MPASDRPDLFLTRSLMRDGRAWPYRVFVPRPRAQRAAVILFLHGSGECGTDNERQLAVGLGPYIRARSAEFPAIAVFPQAPVGSSWIHDVACAALAALDVATADFGGDPERVYLTGLSLGGDGTWSIALREPRRFAALVPICAGLATDADGSGMTVPEGADEPDPFAAAASALRGVPIWIFHGARDDQVPPAQSRRMAGALRAVGGDIHYTEYPDAGHNAWDRAYATPELWDWLFAQRRR